MRSIVDQRSNKRMKCAGITVDIDNGRFVTDGYIEDLSVDGIRVTQLPQRFLVKDEKFITIISGYNKAVRLELTPCWVMKKYPGSYQIVGFRIVDPTESWIEFVKNACPGREH